MISKSVWRSTIVAIVAFVGSALVASAPAFAQFRNFAGDEYSDPGYGGGSAYDPFYYPDQRQRARPQTYDQDPRYPQPQYVDPYDGGRATSGGAPTDYDLGASVNQRTMREIPNPTSQPPGTIVIDTASRHLYYTQPNGQALEYGIGVGRQGFAWKGTAKVERKAEWPNWTPPAEMIRRRPDLPTRMEGGMENPLGARALYLFQGNRDTLFRIHGTNEPETIGKAVSSGCIRMMNGDVIDLYQRVPVGTKVVVL